MSTPIIPTNDSLPPTTAITDPEARRFAAAVRDAIAAIQSPKGAVVLMTAAAEAMQKVYGTPPSVAQWLFNSKVYQDLTRGIDAVQVTAEGNEAAIGVHEATLSTNTQAIAQALNTMWGIVGTTSAVTQSGNNLIVNWSAAEASRWDQINAEVMGVGGHTIRVALQEEADARVTLAGDIAATWTVRVDANGHVAGIGLGVEGGPGGSTSQFIVNTNKFVVTDPDNGVTAFYVDNGVPVFTGTVYAQNGVFGGSLNAATGTFAGSLAAGVIDFSALAGTSDAYGVGVYTITVPDNPDWNGVSMRVSLQAAGGGGGGANTWSNGSLHLAGGGGEAGEWLSQTFEGLTPGATYTLTVGTGGLVSPASAGGKGGDTLIQSGATVLVSAEGGNPGQPGSNSVGGAGGTGIPGAQDGTAGQGLFDNNAYAQGGIGGSSIYGTGGSGNGGIGAGGGGVSMNQFSNRTGGGNGGDGYAVIEFYDANVVVLRSTYNNLISWLDATVSPVPANAR